MIGAGVVGSADRARTLPLRRVLRPRRGQCGCGDGHLAGQHRNWHTGFDAKPGGLEARLVQHGYTLLSQFVPEAGVPFEALGRPAGGLEQRESARRSIAELRALQRCNGRPHRVGRSSRVYQREPHLAPGALGGL